MKKLIGKLFLLTVSVALYVGICCFFDAYNIFHPKDIRITYMTPNQNYIKTKYILGNKDKFNAFIFGSSRAANLPANGLPDVDSEGNRLKWYNMTYAMGAPEENYLTMKTFVDNGVDIKCAVVMIDEISMWKALNTGLDEPIFSTYQTYEKEPLKFYYSYIKIKPVWKLFPEIVDNYRATSSWMSKNDNSAYIADNKKLFYDYGIDINNTEMDVPKSGEMPKAERSLVYNADDCSSVRGLQNIVNLCKENDIELVVIANPVLETTYKEGVENGYLDFLKDVASITDYYCFSGLNTYTTDGKYWFDSSHFRPYVGYKVEQVLFGTPKEKEEADKEARSEESVADFGVHVTADNVDQVISQLQNEIVLSE